MKILAIETSCDETAISVVEGRGGLSNPKFRIYSSVISSQVEIHAAWGGVVPNLARREHEKNLVPVLIDAIKKSKLKCSSIPTHIYSRKLKQIEKILAREPELCRNFKNSDFLKNRLKIDAIAVTRGPGLEPALWAGINFARALSILWDLPIRGINHMEGHLVSGLLNKKVKKVEFPALALLVSGGHTELVLLKKWAEYKLLGQTRDDAAGEAFDKVAKMLLLPYPGGPKLSKLAIKGDPKKIDFPRPMINSNNFDFSFSGLKTSALYYLRENPKAQKKHVAASFEQAAVDVLASKTLKAALKHDVRTVIIGGGVAANLKLRNTLKKLVKNKYSLILPDINLTGDNAAMIGAAAYLQISKKSAKHLRTLNANATLEL